MGVYYPPLGFHFRVEFDLPGISDNDFRFREVEGLSAELDVETVTEGGENRFSHKLPGVAKYPDLILKRGLLTSSVVRSWVDDALQNLSIDPITVWVTLLNEEHEPLKTFTVENAWPKKWEVSSFNAESSDIVVESMELAYSYFTME
jgi:phage tail-like protein